MPRTSSGEIIVTNFRGLNVKDNALYIDDSEAQIATNIVVTDGAVEVRGGLELHSENTNVTGGIPMMTPYYKRDGTEELIFANDNDYYFITPSNTTWQHIGDYGTAADNPYAYQFKDTIYFGTGLLGNTSYQYNSNAVSVTDTTIAFNDANPDTITDSNNGFGDFEGLSVVTISGSGFNDSVVKVTSAGAGQLTLVASESLTAEPAGASVTITATGFKILNSQADTTGDLRFFTQFLGKNIRYLLGGGLQKDDADKNITTVFYTTDGEDWGAGSGVIQVGPSDGQDVTGFVQNNELVIQKEKARHRWDSFYEENSGNFALRELGVDRSSGGVNHETILSIDGDVVSLVGKGKSIEGFGLDGTSQGNARPKQYATNINPILDNLNWQKSIIAKSRGIFHNRKAFFSAPYQSSQFNNILLVGDWDTPTKNYQPSWTTWGKGIGSMAVFRDSNGEDQLYLGDATEPKIYRYNPNVYSDNGNGYRRVWKSKKFSLNRQSDYDNGQHVLIEGYIRLNTEFTLTVITDGTSQSWKIDKNQLINGDGGGGLIGDNHIGDEFIGGNGVASDKFRYQAIAFLPNSQRYIKNIEIQIENNGAGQFWSLDYLSINENINMKNIPANHKNLEQII